METDDTIHKSDAIDVSVIIINFNTLELTKKCIASIYQHSQKNTIEVLVFDNGSTDGSAVILSKLGYDNYYYMYNTANIGFSRANNAAALQASGDYLFFMNSDMFLLNDVVFCLWETLENDPTKGIAGPRFQNPDGTLQVSCRQFPNILFGLSKFIPFTKALLSKEISDYYQQKRDYLKQQNVDTVSAGALMISRNLFFCINGFDEFSFMYAEDADICRRIRDQGLSVTYCPRARLVHYGGQSSRLNSYRAIWSYYFAFYHLYRKYYFGKGAFFIKPLFFLRACLAVVANFFNSDKRITWGDK